MDVWDECSHVVVEQCAWGGGTRTSLAIMGDDKTLIKKTLESVCVGTVALDLDFGEDLQHPPPGGKPWTPHV